MAASLNIVDWFTQLDEKQRDLFQDENPDFFCSITLELMLAPVVAPDGHTYD